MNNMKTLYTGADLARELGVCKHTVRHHAQKGRLKPVARIKGTGWELYEESELDNVKSLIKRSDAGCG